MKPLTERQLHYYTKQKTEVLFYDVSCETWHVGILNEVGHSTCQIYIKNVECCPYYYPLHNNIFLNTPENKLEILLNGQQLVNG